MCMGKHICLSKILFGVLLLCLVSSCRQESRNFDYYLELAEENLETAPDSTAYHLLHDSIDDSMLSSATQRQLITYWYLLARMSMTLSVKVPKDFYLSACARYFSENEPSPLAVKTFVLWSGQLRGSGDYSYAIVPALRAYKAALDLDNEGLRLMAERELAEVLGRAPGIRDAVPHIDCLVDFVGGAGKLDRLATLSKFVFDAGCDTVSSSVTVAIDSIPAATSKIDKAFGGLGLHAVMGDFDKAEIYGDSLLIHMSGRGGHAAACADVANVKAELGKYDGASALLALARGHLVDWRDSLHYGLAVAKLADKSGMTDDRKVWKNVADSLFDNHYDDLIRRTLSLRLQNIYEDETNMALFKEEKTRKQLVLSLIGITLSLILGILFYRYRIQKKNAEINRKITEVMLLTRELDEAKADNTFLDKRMEEQSSDMSRLIGVLSEKETEISMLSAAMTYDRSERQRLSAMVSDLLRGRFSHLNTIINEYSGLQESEENYFVFYKNIEYELEKIRRPKNIAEIERMVDECKDGIIGKLRVQIPGMKDRDVTLVTLTLAGLNARAVGLFLGIQGNSTYKLKKQIINQISGSDAEDKDWFLCELGSC